jgi:hypothetical protein
MVPGKLDAEVTSNSMSESMAQVSDEVFGIKNALGCTQVHLADKYLEDTSNAMRGTFPIQYVAGASLFKLISPLSAKNNK